LALSDQDNAPQGKEEEIEGHILRQGADEADEADVEGHRIVSKSMNEADEPDVEGHRITNRTVN
jgi:hypothetical protein